MNLSVRLPAGPHEVFASDAADALVGQPFDAKIGEMSVGEGRVASARVVEDGQAVDLVVEWPVDLRLSP